MRSRYYIAIANVPLMLPYVSHSATSLYNSANLSQSAISLTCERAEFGLVFLWLFFAIFTFWLQKYIDFVLFSPFYLRYYYLLTWKLILIW